MASHYLRRDLPDGYADRLNRIATELTEGAADLHRGSQSRDQSDRYHAAIDADRLMRRIAKTVAAMAKLERLPG